MPSPGGAVIDRLEAVAIAFKSLVVTVQPSIQPQA